MRREHLLTRRLQKYDSKLVCIKMDNGNLAVFRKDKRYDVFSVDGIDVLYFRDKPHYIFSLTDNWAPHGVPVEWPYHIILERLQKGDSWNRNAGDETIKALENSYTASNRKFKSQLQDIAGEVQPIFKKAFNDFNTSTVSNKLTRNQRLAEERSKIGKE